TNIPDPPTTTTSEVVFRYGGGVHFQKSPDVVFRATVFDGNLIDIIPSSVDENDSGSPEGLNHHIGNRDGADIDIAGNYWAANGPTDGETTCESEGWTVDLTLGFSGNGQGVVNPTHDGSDTVFDEIFQVLADAEYQDIDTKE